MPFYKQINIKQNTTIYLWKITEDVTWFHKNVQLNQNSLTRLKTMLSEAHQCGFMAIRMLLQHIGSSDFNLFYDETGKPFLEVGCRELEVRSTKSLSNITISQSLLVSELKTPNSPLPAPNSQHISISHSHQFSAICISNQPIGIDLEILKPKTLKIAPRFMDIVHLENLSETEQLQKATVVWGVKESVFKLVNKKGISFTKHISEKPFNLQDKQGLATLNFNNQTQNFNFWFDFLEDYALVCVW